MPRMIKRINLKCSQKENFSIDTILWDSVDIE